MLNIPGGSEYFRAVNVHVLIHVTCISTNMGTVIHLYFYVQVLTPFILDSLSRFYICYLSYLN